MVPEADSGSQGGGSKAVPEGWEDVGNGLLRPILDERTSSRLQRRLEEDEQAAKELASLKRQFDSRLNGYREHRQTWEESDHKDDQAIIAMTQFMETDVSEIKDAAAKAASRCVNAVADFYTWMTYLLTKLLGPDLAEHLMGVPQPSTIFLRANASRCSVDLAVAPGDLVMKFTTASATERERFGPAIKLLQREWGYQKDQGGPLPRPLDQTKGDQVRVMAKLYHWAGWTHAQIAEIFGWRGNAKSDDEKIRLYIRDGEKALANETELGPDWQSNPPSVLDDLHDRR